MSLGDRLRYDAVSRREPLRERSGVSAGRRGPPAGVLGHREGHPGAGLTLDRAHGKGPSVRTKEELVTI